MHGGQHLEFHKVKENLDVLVKQWTESQHKISNTCESACNNHKGGLMRRWWIACCVFGLPSSPDYRNYSGRKQSQTIPILQFFSMKCKSRKNQSGLSSNSWRVDSRGFSSIPTCQQDSKPATGSESKNWNIERWSCRNRKKNINIRIFASWSCAPNNILVSFGGFGL